MSLSEHAFEAERTLHALDRSHLAMVAAITRARAISEEAILGIGAQLETIVRDAKSHIEESDALLKVLRSGSRGDSGARLKENREKLATFEARLTSVAEAQSQLAEQILEKCSRLQMASQTLTKITQASSILVLQVQIEAAQLQGATIDLGGIAESLALVGERVEQISSRVSTLVQALQRILPEIVDLTRDLRLLTWSHLADLDRHGKAMDRGVHDLERRLVSAVDTARKQLAGILARSQAALGLLQFQDPMIQRLQRIDGLLAETRTACLPPADEVAGAAPKVFSTNLGDRINPNGATALPEAGELLLF